jgi:hypothetical protein
MRVERCVGFDRLTLFENIGQGAFRDKLESGGVVGKWA